MNLDIFEILYKENKYGLHFIISLIIIIILFFRYKHEKALYEPFFKKAAKAVSKAGSSLDPSKIINDAMDSAKKFFIGLLDPVKKPFEKFFENIDKEFGKIGKSLNALPKALESIGDDIRKDMEKAMEDLKKTITSPMKGIDEMIADFKKLMCLLETFPNRISNAVSGVDNIFKGIDEQYQLIMKAAGLGFKETSTLTNYSAVFVNSYLKCFVKFLTNIHKCFFYYIVDAFGRFLYLPVKVSLWFLKLYFNLDLYHIEKRIWNGMLAIDQIVYSTMQFHIFHFPESVRKQCYTCIRLKKEVVKKQANVVDHTFNEKIPNMVNGEITNVGLAKIRRGKRQFDEVLAMPRARPPGRVK